MVMIMMMTRMVMNSRMMTRMMVMATIGAKRAFKW